MVIAGRKIRESGTTIVLSLPPTEIQDSEAPSSTARASRTSSEGIIAVTSRLLRERNVDPRPSDRSSREEKKRAVGARILAEVENEIMRLDQPW